MTNTKIVATLGPATEAEEQVTKLMNAGVDVFRLNASHGSAEGRRQSIQVIRKLSKERCCYTGILLDLQGPKIRLGLFEGGSADLAQGNPFTITTKECLGTSRIASTTYVDFARDVKAVTVCFWPMEASNFRSKRLTERKLNAT